MKIDITREIEMAQGVHATVKESTLRVKGPKGELERSFIYPGVTLVVEGNKIVLQALKATKREKMIVGSFEAHITNMVKGVQEVHTYKLKICSGHFPMNVTTSGNEFVVKNFLGEAVPRRMTFDKGVDVKIKDTEIVVSGADKELAGRTAAKIEQLCRITNRDLRVFQDGCYIVQKAGKEI